MIPAYSVIFFTVASGAGYGLLTWLAVAYLSGAWSPDEQGFVTGLVAIAVGTVLVIAGLLSSTLHLGHPERAWRAFSQWRTSWLSREGVLAVASFVPIAGLALTWMLKLDHSPLTGVAATLTIVLAVSTVLSTAMIYASLTTIPRWNNPWVPPLYLGFALASGALLAVCLQAFTATPARFLLVATLALLIIVWLMKIHYWRQCDNVTATSTAESATGLAALGAVAVLESPHTSANYVQKEMGFVIARKHATRLRRLALLFGALLPAVLLFEILLTDGFLQVLLLIICAASILFALVLERWLFFAEAKHVVTLFYGARGV